MSQETWLDATWKEAILEGADPGLALWCELVVGALKQHGQDRLELRTRIEALEQQAAIGKNKNNSESRS